MRHDSRVVHFWSIKQFMKIFTLVFVTLALLVVSALAQTPMAPTLPRRLAFLVGVNHYERNGFKDLRWAEDDVADVEKELRSLGFEPVVVLKGSGQGRLRATKKNIEAELLDLLKKSSLTKDDVVLVMLSGHGQQLASRGPDGQIRRDNFFCPADAVTNEPETMVSLSYLTDDLLFRRGGRNLLLVDACRDGLVDRDRGVRSRGLDGPTASIREGTAILFSCSQDQKSDERDELKHGVFTHCLLGALRSAEGPITWIRLVQQVEDQMAELNPNQVPIMAGQVPRLVLGVRSVERTHADTVKPISKPAVTVTPKMGTQRASSLIGSRAGEEWDGNGLRMRFCWCPPGRFKMGSPKGEVEDLYDFEKQTDVEIANGFWLGKYEVTQAEWSMIMGSTIEDQMRKATYKNLYGKGNAFPMYYVNREEVNEFCRRLTEAERVSGRLPEGWVFHLPTEAQWEYACRAGTKSRFSFGDSEKLLDQYAWTYSNAGNASNPVGEKPPNAWGFCDMHGNVDELCHTNSRGGDWETFPKYCRSASRSLSSTSGRLKNRGFRIAIVPSGG